MTSPENIKTHAPWVTPPLRVIPVIYVPGIMGRNLKTNPNAGNSTQDTRIKNLNPKLKGS